MKLAQLTSSLVIASTLFAAFVPTAKADDLASQMVGKVQCSTGDVALGNNVQNNVNKSDRTWDLSKSGNSASSGNSSSSSASQSSSKAGGGGGFSIFGIGANGSGSSEKNQSSKSSQSNGFSNKSAFSNLNKGTSSSFSDKSSSTVVVGKMTDCDSNNAAMADMFKSQKASEMNADNNRTDIQINNTNNETARKRIDADVDMNRDNNKTRVQMLDMQRRDGQLQNLIKW
ncbi:hypothetical protein [Alkalinema sp. FACHB-956]|uniref:hypothetical protein n=1 Tax=Alkalinema sp. FACHB-956 TaxID=2692768 RepID=UPI00168638D0|nr:hypothetical protein [Alkalinema sp. FACHB-956]MBD2328277.1 hypothetical protein [Alkalinema sp. FACHB-956]